MLDLSQLREQLDAFEEFEVDLRRRRTDQCRRAEEALRACSNEWADVQASVEAAEPSRLVAAMRESPVDTVSEPVRPTPVTVVATDGSQIYPDRHVDPLFFLINVSRIGFQYGTQEEALIDTVPELHFEDDVSEHLNEVLGSMTRDVVSALRDEMELEHLLRAAETSSVDGRPMVALADGTLIRWMIRGMNNEALEEELLGRYTEYLEGFRRKQIPMASYVSMPATTEVVNLARFVLGELSVPVPREVGVSLEGPPLKGLLDRHVFERLLESGERSATFGSTSHVQRSYPEETEVCFYYLCVPSSNGPGEIARVEIPRWVAADGELMDRIHATVLRECEKGEGYPLILSEAHERAVIRGAERDAFFRLMDRRLREAGLSATHSRKQQAKQRPKV